MYAPKPTGQRRSGFSLVEVMFALVFSAGLMIVIGFVTKRASNSFSAGVTRQSVQVNAHRAIDTALDAFKKMELGSVGNLSLGDDSVKFNRVNGYNGGALTGEVMSFFFEYDPAELDDGLDNDSDGLVDEGRLVMVLDPDGATPQRVVLCSGVSEFLEGETSAAGDENGNGFFDESGFFVDIQDNIVTVRLTLAALDKNGQMFVSTVESSVPVRN